jgi:hypothetical protein
MVTSRSGRVVTVVLHEEVLRCRPRRTTQLTTVDSSQLTDDVSFDLCVVVDVDVALSSRRSVDCDADVTLRRDDDDDDDDVPFLTTKFFDLLPSVVDPNGIEKWLTYIGT